MTKVVEALKLALEALEEAHYVIEHKQDVTERGQAITAIKEALAQPEQEPTAWIAVSDGLPLDQAQYLVFVLDAGGEHTYVKQSSLNRAHTGFYVEYDSDGHNAIEKVTHWMPLPAAPQGETHD